MTPVATEPAAVAAGTKPVQTFRLRGLSASIFENHAKDPDSDVTFHKVSLQRTYKDGEEFKTTTSLGRDDLPVAVLLLQRAWEYILDAEAHRKRDDEE